MPGSELVEHCVELLSPLGAVRARRMFGGHGLYVDELFIALILGQRLYLKVDTATRARFEAAGCQPFVYEGRSAPVTVSYWTVPTQAMESAADMLPWARLAIDAALRARQRKPTGARKKAVSPTRARNTSRRSDR